MVVLGFGSVAEWPCLTVLPAGALRGWNLGVTIVQWAYGSRADAESEGGDERCLAGLTCC